MPALKRLEVSRELSPNSALMRSIIQQTERELTQLLNGMSDEIVAEVNKIIANEFENARPPIRRKPGQRHLLGSIRVETNPTAARQNVIAELIVTSSAEKHKVAALELGSPFHIITPNEGRFLYFPSSIVNPKTGQRGVFGRSYQAQGGLQPRSFAKTSRPAAGYKRLAKTDFVGHPGNRAYGFMKRGLEKVIKQTLAGARIG